MATLLVVGGWTLHGWNVSAAVPGGLAWLLATLLVVIAGFAAILSLYPVPTRVERHFPDAGAVIRRADLFG